MADVITASVKGIVRNIVGTFWGSGSELQLAALAHGQLAVADVHGKYFEVNFRGKLFSANATAIAIPLVSTTVPSLFTLWNPPGSGVVAEIVRTTLGQVLATTVVDAIGWYSSTATQTAAGTFTTLGVPRSCRVQDPATNAIKFYSAYTVSGLPVREDIIGSFGAVTDVSLSLPDKQHEGGLILPEGIAIHVLASTAITFTAGLDVQCIWAEWPKQ